MANGIMALMCEITIDSTNKWIDTSVGVGTTSIAEGTYDDIFAVATALQTALQVLDGTFTVTVGATGYVTIARTGTFTIDWKTGTHGSDNADDHIGTVLGYDDSADDSGAATYTSDWVALYVWVHTMGPEYDSYDDLVSVGPATFKTTSGNAERMTIDEYYDRDLHIAWVADAEFRSAASSVRGAFEDWWTEAAAGTPFSFYSDTDVWTDEGDYVLDEKANATLGRKIRYSPGDGYYRIQLAMVKQ